jgi:hypothetical protein
MNLVLYTLDPLNHSTSFFLQASVPLHVDLCIKILCTVIKIKKGFCGTIVASVVSESK